MEKVLKEMHLLKSSIEHKMVAQDHRMGTLEKLLWGVIIGLIGLVITLIFKH